MFVVVCPKLGLSKTCLDFFRVVYILEKCTFLEYKYETNVLILTIHIIHLSMAYFKHVQTHKNIAITHKIKSRTKNCVLQQGLKVDMKNKSVNNC